MNRSISMIILSLSLVCVWVAFSKTESGAAAKSRTTEMQDVASLDRRISMMEQRLYFFESSMRRLEQQVSQPTSSLSNQERTQTALLRNDVENLKAQIQVLTCGLSKVDERTLQPSLRQSHRENGGYVDPCRLNPETPLRLTTRQ